MAYIGITVDDAVKDQLEKEAQASFRSLSAQVAHIIKLFFSSQESQNTITATKARNAQNPSLPPPAVDPGQNEGSDDPQDISGQQSGTGSQAQDVPRGTS